MKRVNLENRRFGRLTVQSYAGFKHLGKVKKPMWVCKCDCGSVTEVEGSNLRKGTSTSCGCYHKELTSGVNSPFYTGGLERAEFRRQVKGAKKRGLSFNLSEQQVKDLFSGDCFYCDRKPVKDNRGYVRNGIDRWNNFLGYESDNVVTCCSGCNKLKGDMDGIDFIMHIKQINSVISEG